MSAPIFKSNTPDFLRKNDAFIDMVQGHMAMDIEVALKNSAGMPVKTGAMKSETRHFRSASGGFRVEIGKAYASFQEAGVRQDGSHVVKKYTTGGTGKGFFKRAINMVVKNRENYISEAKRALNL